MLRRTPWHQCWCRAPILFERHQPVQQLLSRCSPTPPLPIRWRVCCSTCLVSILCWPRRVSAAWMCQCLLHTPVEWLTRMCSWRMPYLSWYWAPLASQWTAWCQMCSLAGTTIWQRVAPLVCQAWLSKVYSVPRFSRAFCRQLAATRACCRRPTSSSCCAMPACCRHRAKLLRLAVARQGFIPARHSMQASFHRHQELADEVPGFNRWSGRPESSNSFS